MFEQSRQYFLYDGPCDMRKGFNTLAGLVGSEMKLSVTSGAGFVFINRRKTHLKMLLWEGDGFSLYFKRLEKGTFEHPSASPNYHLSFEKLILIIRGINTQNIVKRKRFSLAATG
jgi:transposase